MSALWPCMSSSFICGWPTCCNLAVIHMVHGANYKQTLRAQAIWLSVTDLDMAVRQWIHGLHPNHMPCKNCNVSLKASVVQPSIMNCSEQTNGATLPRRITLISLLIGKTLMVPDTSSHLNDLKQICSSFPDSAVWSFCSQCYDFKISIILLCREQL